MKQNSIIGPYDANGNGQAVKDGVLEAWINGQLVFKRDDFRWRRHPDFGVQGLWLDVYHGGKLPAPYDIGYCIDRVTVSKKYIGPR